MASARSNSRKRIIKAFRAKARTAHGRSFRLAKVAGSDATGRLWAMLSPEGQTQAARAISGDLNPVTEEELANAFSEATPLYEDALANNGESAVATKVPATFHP